MYDYTFSESSINLNTISFCLFTFVTTLNWRRALKINTDIDRLDKHYIFIFIGILSYTLCDFRAGDFFHYQEMVKTYDLFTYNNIEPIYGIFIHFVQANYLMFRVLVWGLALLLFTLTAKRFQSGTFLSLFVLFSVFITTFAYARASLAMSIYFFGLSFLCQPLRKIPKIGYFIGIIIIISSYFFHHSILIMIALTIVILIPINKYTITILFLMMPLIVYFGNQAFINILSSNNFTDEISNKLNTYSTREQSVGPSAILINTLEYASYYIPAIVLFYKFYFSSDRKRIIIERYIYRLGKVTLSIIIFATIFLFFGLKNQVFFYRILYFSYIPLIILLCSAYMHNIIRYKTFKLIILFGLLAQITKLGYSIYAYTTI